GHHLTSTGRRARAGDLSLRRAGPAWQMVVELYPSQLVGDKPVLFGRRYSRVIEAAAGQPHRLRIVMVDEGQRTAAGRAMAAGRRIRRAVYRRTPLQEANPIGWIADIGQEGGAAVPAAHGTMAVRHPDGHALGFISHGATQASALRTGIGHVAALSCHRHPT